MPYEKWLERTKQAFLKITNGMLELDDVPDVVDLYDCWENGKTPEQAAYTVLKENQAEGAWWAR